jgi:hypothetical protein
MRKSQCVGHHSWGTRVNLFFLLPLALAIGSLAGMT